MKHFTRFAIAAVVIFMIPSIAITQNFRVAEWDMTMDEVAAVETVPLQTSKETAIGSSIPIAGIDYDVTYTFADETILTQEVYTHKFEDEAARNEAYDELRIHLSSKYGDPTEDKNDKWLSENAIISLEISPTSISIRVENVESPEDRIERKKRVLEEYKIALMEEIGASEHPIRIKACGPYGNDFANGVSVQVLFDYYGPTTIKYMYFTVTPYNDKGQVQKCNSKGHTSYTFEIMGPFRSSKISNDVSWDEIWKNPDITCVRLTKLKVEYVDGKKYTYANELSKILWPHFMNKCR